MIHKHLQTDIIGGDGSALLSLSVLTTTDQGVWRVDFGEQETGLRSALIAIDKSWNWEAIQ